MGTLRCFGKRTLNAERFADLLDDLRILHVGALADVFEIYACFGSAPAGWQQGKDLLQRLGVRRKIDRLGVYDIAFSKRGAHFRLRMQNLANSYESELGRYHKATTFPNRTFFNCADRSCSGCLDLIARFYWCL